MSATRGPRLTVSEPDVLRAHIDGFLRGEHELTGLDLYYALERSTSLLEFHTMLRTGDRNRTHNGLQQSYGDHNRLLMLALDRLLAGDTAWLRDHVDPASTVDNDLAACASAAAALTFSRAELLALWLGAALHDCGMLGGQDAHVDVEDGIEIAREVLDEYCPRDQRDLAAFALHHHDDIKDTFLGEAPVALVADPLARLDSGQRGLSLLALGLIQVAGAASLGEGRLTAFRLEIFRRCLDGTALDDRSSTLRLARLLAIEPETRPPDLELATSAAADLESGDRAALEALLTGTAVHGWHAVARGVDTAERLDALVAVAAHNETWRADRIVLLPELRTSAGTPMTGAVRASIRVALSGSTIVTVLPPDAGDA